MFLHECVEAGLDAAIVHASKILPLSRIEERAKEICLDLVYNRRRDDYDPLQELLALFDGVKVNAGAADEHLDWPVDPRLAQRIIDGNRNGLEGDLTEALDSGLGALAIVNDILLEGMKVVGERFASGEMQLPFVLQSAETMKTAVAFLEPHMEKADQGGKEALREVFRACVKVAAAQGLIGMICHAVDGTKIRAVASRRTVEHQENLEKLLARVEEELGKMEAEIEAAELAPGGDYRLPEGLREAEKLRAKILESLAYLRQAERAHLHPQEREARLMPCEGRTDPAYNAQAMADAKAGIIVAAEAVNAEADNGQLIPMLEATEANLGGVAETTLADGGYVSGEQLQEAEERGQAVRVAAGGEKGGHPRGRV